MNKNKKLSDITVKEFDDLTEKAMKECGLLEDNKNVENN